MFEEINIKLSPDTRLVDLIPPESFRNREQVMGPARSRLPKRTDLRQLHSSVVTFWQYLNERSDGERGVVTAILFSLIDTRGSNIGEIRTIGDIPNPETIERRNLGPARKKILREIVNLAKC